MCPIFFLFYHGSGFNTWYDIIIFEIFLKKFVSIIYYYFKKRMNISYFFYFRSISIFKDFGVTFIFFKIFICIAKNIDILFYYISILFLLLFYYYNNK